MDAITSRSPPDLISVELSSRRTGMSFRRTRMSAVQELLQLTLTFSLPLEGCRNRPSSASMEPGTGEALGEAELRFSGASAWKPC
jgi:hypothetical protein